MRVKDYNKIDLIFKASLELILNEGIAGITMSKLAKKAGIATGTLYIYFKNKEELLQKLYINLRQKSQERFMKGYDESEPFKIGLKKVWLNYLKHRVQYYEESVFLEQYYRSPYITKEHKEMAESMKHPVHELIQRGKKELLVKNDFEDEMLFSALIGFIRELANDHVNKVYELTEERIEKAFHLSWDMIKT
ncbi:MAG: TetR/AcrR family transcriptional regulator [Bacteroidales bacterium]|nr:TetR/AcrR family transcriptional regulator [Bacteroidales bacterium]